MFGHVIDEVLTDYVDGPRHTIHAACPVELLRRGDALPPVRAGLSPALAGAACQRDPVVYTGRHMHVPLALWQCALAYVSYVIGSAATWSEHARVSR